MSALSVHSIEWSSRANGPGVRAVVWTQGCTLACAGCFNPLTHVRRTETHAVDDLARDLIARAQDGVTITGGEPFQQWEVVGLLLRRLRDHDQDLSILVFTGYTVPELHRLHADAVEVLAHIDVLVAGRYVAQRSQHDTPLLGSANQQVHLLSSRHTREELATTPLGEIIIGADGSVTVSGVAPPLLLPASSG